MRTFKYRGVYALLIAVVLTALSSTTTKAQEYTTEEIYENSRYVVMREGTPRNKIDTLRWRHNLRLGISTPSLVHIYFLEGNGMRERNKITTASDRLANLRYYNTATYIITPISFEYSYYTNKWLSVGGKASFTALYSDVRNIATDERLYKNNSYVASAILTLRFDYLRREYVQMYSTIGLGLSARFKYDDGILSPMYDFTLVGISIGKGFYGFGEIGGGICGLFRGGFGYRF